MIYLVIGLMFLFGILGTYGYIQQGIRYKKDPSKEEKPKKDALMVLVVIFLIALFLLFHEMGSHFGKYSIGRLFPYLILPLLSVAFIYRWWNIEGMRKRCNYKIPAICSEVRKVIVNRSGGVIHRIDYELTWTGTFQGNERNHVSSVLSNTEIPIGTESFLYINPDDPGEILDQAEMRGNKSFLFFAALFIVIEIVIIFS